MTELDAVAIKMRKGLSEKTSIITLAAMHEYCCPIGVYELACRAPLVFGLSKTGVSGIGRTVVALSTRTLRSCCSVSTTNIVRSVSFAFFVIVWLSSDALCTISIGTGCKLYVTTFLTAGKILSTYLSLKEVPKRTETAIFLTIPSTTRMRASSTRTRSIIVPATSTL